MGAWIETIAVAGIMSFEDGRSLMGAWIETRHKRLEIVRIRVAPLWERGLKHRIRLYGRWKCRVAPLWERGLKRSRVQGAVSVMCRSLMGAWIETFIIYTRVARLKCRSLMGAWIETLRPVLPVPLPVSLPYGSVD